MNPADARFNLDLAQYRLFDGDRPVSLERQPMELLRLLASKRGDLVSREEIVAALWPDGTNVSEDQSINRAIRKLRIALGDNPERPQYIETVVGKGYRLIGAVAVRQAVNGSSPIPPAPTPVSNRPVSYQRVGLIGLVLVAITGWILYAIRPRPAPPAIPLPLTAFAGDEEYPSLSPGGDLVAFAWNGERRDNWDIYVKTIGGAEAPLRLTTEPSDETMPAWSPNGRWIAFERQTVPDRFDLCLVSPLGGVSRCVVTGLRVRRSIDFSSPSWSPDSRLLMAADFDPVSRTSRIIAITVDSGQIRVLTSTSTAAIYKYPAEAPDARSLAYESCTIATPCDTYCVDLDRQMTRVGAPRQVTRDGHQARGIAWMPDSASLVYGDGLRHGLHRVWVRTGATEVVTGAIGGMFPSLSSRGDRLVFAEPAWDVHLWIFRRGGTAAPETLLPSSLVDVNPQLTADGTRITFGSERAGIGRQIWVGRVNGESPPVAITEPTGRAQGSPRWSADGHWIAYDAQSEDGHRHVYLIDGSGGHRVRLTSDPSDENMPSWSRDNHFVYFASSRTGRAEIWRVGLDHSGAPEQITSNGGLAAFESPDGLSIFYTKSNGGETPLFTKVLGRANETVVVPSVYRSDFVPLGGGVYYVTHAQSSNGDEFQLCFLDLATHETRVLNRFEAFDVVGLTVSADGQNVVTSAARPSAGFDLAWIPSFR